MVEKKMRTYVTIKNVKYVWGSGQEDIYPVAQFEKLWGDMTALSEVDTQFIVVPTIRGQQLKEQSQLDGWLRDGSAAVVHSLWIGYWKIRFCLGDGWRKPGLFRYGFLLSSRFEIEKTIRDRSSFRDIPSASGHWLLRPS